MNLQQCSNGHYYDAERFSSCPHCAAAGSVNPIMPSVMNDGAGFTGEPDVTVPITGNASLATAAEAADSEVTVRFYDNKINANSSTRREPVVGWLVCTKGKLIGEDYRLKCGRNFIGRSTGMDVVLKDEPSVSREKHAIIIFDPHANSFIAAPGDSHELFYVNDAVVISAVDIKRGDRIQLGDVELLFIPCCDDSFRWDFSNDKKD